MYVVTSSAPTYPKINVDTIVSFNYLVCLISMKTLSWTTATIKTQRLFSLFKDAKQLYWNRTLAWVFSCKFAAYFENTFYEEHLWLAASELRRSISQSYKLLPQSVNYLVSQLVYYVGNIIRYYLTKIHLFQILFLWCLLDLFQIIVRFAYFYGYFFIFVIYMYLFIHFIFSSVFLLRL